jgi:hypothetical protein
MGNISSPGRASRLQTVQNQHQRLFEGPGSYLNSSAVGQIIFALAIMALGGGSPLRAAAPPVTNGLVVCLQADAINARDPAEVTQQGANQTVASWFDQSGNGFNATQPSASLQPLYIASALNGKPVVRFNGLTNFLATTLPQITGDKSIFIVQRRDQFGQGDLFGRQFRFLSGG